MIYTKAYRKDGHGSTSRETVSWHRHTFYFEALETSMNLTIGSVDVTTGIFLDHLTFELVEKSSNQNEGQTVSAHIVSLHEWGSIHGSWGFIEDISHIADYTWAIGMYVLVQQCRPSKVSNTSKIHYIINCVHLQII